MKYKLRSMEIDDIMSVVEGETKIFKTSLGYDMIYQDLVLNPYAHYIVLDIDGEVRGYIGLWVEDSVDVINFYIDEEYQGMGFGCMIMDFVIQLCMTSKVKNISLEVRKSNIKAINLYEKYGLKKAYERKKYYNDGEDAFVMIREFEE